MAQVEAQVDINIFFVSFIHSLFYQYSVFSISLFLNLIFSFKLCSLIILYHMKRIFFFLNNLPLTSDMFNL